jgi:hypothetical protein
MRDVNGRSRPGVIELSVIRGRTNRLAPLEWLMVLRLAEAHGWEPDGAVAFSRDGLMLARDPWYGLAPDAEIGYRSIDGGDVRRLAAALLRGAAAVGRESDAALADAVTAESGPARSERPSGLDYFVEQGLAADWLEQLADDLADTTTILVHGDMEREWESVLKCFAGAPDEEPAGFVDRRPLGGDG